MPVPQFCASNCLFFSSVQCVTIYTEFQHSCFLYLGSIVVDEFGRLSGYQQGLVQFLEAMADVAFPLLAKDGHFNNHPDTLDDLYRFCSR